MSALADAALAIREFRDTTPGPGSEAITKLTDWDANLLAAAVLKSLAKGV